MPGFLELGNSYKGRGNGVYTVEATRQIRIAHIKIGLPHSERFSELSRSAKQPQKHGKLPATLNSLYWFSRTTDRMAQAKSKRVLAFCKDSYKFWVISILLTVRYNPSASR